MKTLLHLLAAGLLLSGLCAILPAQDKSDRNSRDRTKAETTMTGCLNKDASGNYMLTDEKTGAKTEVAGDPDLEKHSANHKVTLSGTEKTEGGKSVFEVSKIQHVSASCTPSK
jgi:hypothetical protein